jgi:hypothetical protein
VGYIRQRGKRTGGRWRGLIVTLAVLLGHAGGRGEVEGHTGGVLWGG